MVDVEEVVPVIFKARDGVIIKRALTPWKQFDIVYGLNCSLSFRVELADAFDLIIKEFQAVGVFAAHWVYIDDRSPHSEFAMLKNGINAIVARLSQVLRKFGSVNALVQRNNEGVAFEV